MKNPFRRGVTRGSLAVAAAVLALVVAAPVQAANDTIDQSQTLMLGRQSNISVLAQTFTAGVTGQLDRVSLAMDMSFGNIRVSIRTTAASGTPSGTTLGSPVAYGTSFVCCRRFHDFNFSPTIPITAGTKYAIVVETVNGGFTWYNSSTLNAYADGQLYVDSTWLTGGQWGEDFAFQTWVATAAPNEPPVVGANSAGVSVREGTAPIETGTYLDLDGDTVALSPSVGTVTKTGTSSGTWSWTQPASRGASSQTVTMSAADGRGHTGTTSFTVTVIPNKPPLASADQPAVSVNEGTAPTNTGTYSDPDGDTVTLTASAGTVSQTGTSLGTWSWTQPASGDSPAQTVTISATDGQGGTATASFTVTVLEVAPSIAAGNAALSVNEGTPATNTGTYSDPGGDTVTLSASDGSVTKTGTSSGTWSWTQPLSDEAAAKTVTISAFDGQGTTTVSFTVTVNAVAPTARIVTDPDRLPEGTTERFTGAATTAFAGDAAALTYSWNVTKNGAAYSSGAGTAFSFYLDDEGTYVVTFQATDDGGMSGTDRMTITGFNVAPIANIHVVQTLVTTTQQTVTFGAGFTDPGKLDSHSVSWNFGDGPTTTANYGPGGPTTFSPTHSYAAPGTYTVTMTVNDFDGGVTSVSTTVQVQTTQQALSRITTVVNGLSSLNAGQKSSLVAKLNAAAAAEARGDRKTCNNVLNAFLNEWQADVKTGKVSSHDATTISDAVYAVKGSLGIYNRFLEWWPLAE